MAITLTERAAEKLKGVFEKHAGAENLSLRIALKGGGCAGFNYMLDVTDKPAEDDEKFESRGIRIVVDPKSMLYLDGTEIDYNDDLLRGGFVFNNPNSKQSCGCGASFSV